MEERGGNNTQKVNVMLTRLCEGANGVPLKTRRTTMFCEKIGSEEQAKRACFPRVAAKVRFRNGLLQSKLGLWFGERCSRFPRSLRIMQSCVRVASSQCCWTGTEESES